MFLLDGCCLTFAILGGKCKDEATAALKSLLTPEKKKKGELQEGTSFKASFFAANLSQHFTLPEIPFRAAEKRVHEGTGRGYGAGPRDPPARGKTPHFPKNESSGGEAPAGGARQLGKLP